MPVSASQHAILLLRDRQMIHASPRAAQISGCSLDDLLAMDLERLLLFFSPSDAKRIERLYRWVEKGEHAEPQTGLCLRDQSGSCTWIDLILSPSFHNGQPAVQMIWIDNSPRMQIEEQLSQNIWRLQILHDIDHAMLSVQDDRQTAEVALRHISYLVADYHSSAVHLIHWRTGEAHLTASDGPLTAPEQPDLWSDLTVHPEILREGLPQVIQDLKQLEPHNPALSRLWRQGVRGGLVVPMRWDGELHGMLSLYSASPAEFSAERVQAAQEIANLLAVAFKQTNLKNAERDRRREAEAMRDVMSALANAGDLNQTLEAILVNLHNVIAYDRASLFLIDENKRFIVAQNTVTEQTSSGQAFHENNPLVNQMRAERRPLIIRDIQYDDRFAGWPEVESVRGWLGAPLLTGDEMIGFLSLGSLKPASFGEMDADRLQLFADQVAQVLERAYATEQTQRRTEELEVLSSVTLALGRVEGRALEASDGENMLHAILKEITHFSGAQHGVFLFPNRLETSLLVKASLDESVLGLSFPSRWDPFWHVYVKGETLSLPNLDSAEAALPNPAVSPPLSPQNQPQLDRQLQTLFAPALAAILVPVKSAGTTFGVLGFGFDNSNEILDDTLRTCSAVAEIAAASLRRAVILETLEKQVDVRTQHLSTLYDINAIASEPHALRETLEQVLRITLESMRGQAGLIHFLSEKGGTGSSGGTGSPGGAGSQAELWRSGGKSISGGAFHLAVQRGLSPDLEQLLQNLPAHGGFWERLANSANPVVINDTAGEPNLPTEFARLYAQGHKAFIGAPIRAKGQVLGLLSLLDRSILDYTLEDITLFMTIADQIGSSVERARLMKQAEIAAVVQERQRLARELHDSVTQLLYGQVLFAGAGLKVLRQGELAMTEQHLARIDQAALQALKEMRLLVYQLRPADYLDEGLAGALARRLDSVEKRTGINARLVVEGDLSLDEAVEMALYRIAEEALNNTLKHAQATSVTITLRAQAGHVILVVADNGIGFDPQAARLAGGMGLENMRERATALNGNLQIHSKPGEGAQVILEFEVEV